MYRSPIEILTQDIQMQIEKQQEEEVYKAIVNVGINVDKEELIRALKYDRNQYKKGYWDGTADALKWIPVTERLPDYSIPSTHYLCYWNGLIRVCKYWRTRKVFELRGKTVKVTHWMPLPQPPKGE